MGTDETRGSRVKPVSIKSLAVKKVSMAEKTVLEINFPTFTNIFRGFLVGIFKVLQGNIFPGNGDCPGHV